jgi:hypothetical protein
VITLSVLSTQYVQVPVDTTFNGTPFNPTGDPVAMAFMPSPPDANPGSGDWKTAVWQTLPNGVYAVRLLIGPGTGGLVLTVGNYNIWLRITDNPEIPTQNVGILRIQ